MSFSYSGDPSDSNIDAVRFYLQDTDEDNPLLSDEEIEFIYDDWYEVNRSLVYVASVAAETISAKFAREVSYSADGVSVSGDQLQQKYNELATSLRDMYKAQARAGGPDVGGIFVDEEFDESIAPLSFSKRMHDNRFAGQQEYGGRSPHFREVETDGSY